jgi:rod shape-determining protein MreD
VKFRAVLGTILVAVFLQVVLSRYAVGGRFVFDLVLVGVVYIALQGGALAGMLGGTLGGLLQDMLSGGIVGTGGLIKTLVGFAAGGIGTQFVVTKPAARAGIVAGATVVHALGGVALQAVIDQRWPGLAWTAMLEEIVVNTVCGFIAFSVTDALPGAVARGRARSRPRFSRRHW